MAFPITNYHTHTSRCKHARGTDRDYVQQAVDSGYQVLGFTDRVYEYMAASDLVLTKPGGITLFETIFSELPILAWEPFLEQEKNNARFLVKRGLGRVAAKEPEECLSAIRALIYDDETLEWMAGNMRAMKGQLEEESLNRMLAGLEAEKGVRVG